jgi:phosphatidylserine/phosphatidylglycerophosphate/cardiolipin synthase-like enzyme
MAEGDQDHSGVAVSVAVIGNGLDQAFDLLLGQVLPCPQLLILQPPRNCSIYARWGDPSEVDGPKAFDVLARRMEDRPALRVTLLLNIQRKRGDSTASDQLVRRFADHFWKTDWPGSSRPNVFYDPRALDLQGPSGVLHAKAVVADDEAVFLTSANLTEAALDRNIELGILIRNHALALTICTYFQTLIDRHLLKLLPRS